MKFKLILIIVIANNQLIFGQLKVNLGLFTSAFQLFSNELLNKSKFDLNNNVFDQYGFEISIINKNKDYFFINYSKWNKGELPYIYNNKVGGLIYSKYSQLGIISNLKYPNKIINWYNYCFLDIGYKRVIKYKKIEILPIASISITRGTNYVIDSFLLPQIPPFDFIETFNHSENQTYFGSKIGCEIGYNIRKRFRISIFTNFRIYINHYLKQFEEGIRIDYKISK